MSVSVLTATVHYVRQRLSTEGVRATGASLLRSRRASVGTALHTRDSRSGAALADDFLGVLDHFPELRTKRVIVMELNDRGGSTGFLAALAERTKGRENLGVVRVDFEPDDFFRFDGHLVPKGHEKVATVLDSALGETPMTSGMNSDGAWRWMTHAWRHGF